MPDKKPSRSFPHRVLRLTRWLLLVVIVAIGSLFIPAVFQWSIRQAIAFQAWRLNGNAQIGEVSGSLEGEPLVVKNLLWVSRSAAGSNTHLEIERAEAAFAWKELLPGGDGPWFRRLSLDGVTGKVYTPAAPASPARASGKTTPAPAAGGVFAGYPIPAAVEARRVDLVFQRGDDYVQLQQSRWRFSEAEQGFVEVGQLVLKQPWLSRTFHNINGITAVKEGQVVMADLKLDPGVTITQVKVQPAALVRGLLNLNLEIKAFGGEMKVQANPVQGRRDEVDATGSFSQIQIAPLATFLGISDAAGGTIKQGTLTFLGSPHDPARAICTLRLEATNFQWETRQWDSLTLGMTLMDRRLQLPELLLRQGHNNLSLNGEMALPVGGKSWWQSDFNCTIAAQIDNLTELSALLLPEFQYTTGQVTVDGSVHAKDQQFSGHLIVSGKDISWRNTPIQELRGAVRLSGKEIQIASLDLLNRDDYLHGQGVVSLSGDYRGDFRASVEDFGKYANVLENPVLPSPVAGGAVLRWTGQGSTPKGHTGRFFARLQKLRPAQAEGAQSHPVDAEIEGAYEPGKTVFSRLNLADEQCAFSTQVELTAKTVKLTGLRLLNGAQTWLEGDALLPREFFRNWMEPLPAAPAGPGTPLKLNLKATGLSLKHAVRLSGWNWPVEGFVDGEITGDGTLGKLKLDGQCTLVNGHIPIGWNGDALDAVRGVLRPSGQVLSFVNASATHRTGKYIGHLELDLAKYRDPVLSGSAHCDRASFPVYEALPATPLQPPSTPLWCEASCDLHIAGPVTTAVIKGTVTPFRFRLTSVPPITFLWQKSPTVEAPIPFTALVAPFYRWQLQVGVESAAPVPVLPGEGTILPKLELRGTGRVPALVGSVTLENVPATGGPLSLTIKTATVTFRDGQPRDPMIDVHATGVIDHFPFNAYALGLLSRHMAFADSQEALSCLTPAAGSAGVAPLQNLEQPSLLHGASALPWAPIFVPNGEAKLPPPAPAPAAPASKAD